MPCPTFSMAPAVHAPPSHEGTQLCARRSALLLRHAHGAALAPGGLCALPTHAQSRVVSQATVSPDLLQALKIVTHLHVHGVRHDLRVFAVLRVLFAIQHPIRYLELPRVLDDSHQALNLLSFFAADVGEPAAHTLDGCQGKHDLDLSVKVGVQHTQNVLKVSLVHYHGPHGRTRQVGRR